MSRPGIDHDTGMISYSQNLEDVILARVLAGVPPGFYVDVGANHPEHDSVTKHFSDLGWRGINVEPGRYFADLVTQRPRDINLNLAVSATEGTATFYEGASPGLAGLQPDVPEHLRLIVGERKARTVPTLPLQTILDRYAPPVIDFLSVDVEGHEPVVLASHDWKRHRPRVVMVEATKPGSPEPNHHAWEPTLFQSDYLFAFFDGLNRYYVRREDRALLERFGPACVFDNYVPVELARLRAGDPVVSAAVKVLQQEREYLQNLLADRDAEIARLKQVWHGAEPFAMRFSLWMARRLSGIHRRLWWK